MNELDQCWKNCLRMWKWIAKNWKRSDNVVALKRKWLEKNGFTYGSIAALCFFCDHARLASCTVDCRKCPGKLVNSRFYCMNESYNYYEKPKKFYAKLLHLDAIRRGTKMIIVAYKSKRQLKKEIGKKLDYTQDGTGGAEYIVVGPDSTFFVTNFNDTFKATVTIVDGVITKVR